MMQLVVYLLSLHRSKTSVLHPRIVSLKEMQWSLNIIICALSKLALAFERSLLSGVIDLKGIPLFRCRLFLWVPVRFQTHLVI